MQKSVKKHLELGLGSMPPDPLEKILVIDLLA